MTDHELATLSTGLRIEVLKSATRIVESVLMQGADVIFSEDTARNTYNVALKLLQKEYKIQMAEIAVTPPAK